MRINGEWFFLMNVWVDCLALFLASQGASIRFFPVRALLAASLGAAYALASYGLWPALRSFPGLALGALLTAWAAFGGRAGMGWPWVMASEFALSGLSGFLWRQGIPAGWVMLLCGGLTVLAVRIRGKMRLPAWNLGKMTVTFCDRTAVLPALRDSGNLLRDPVTGLPVIVAPAGLLSPWMPKGVSLMSLSALPKGFRLICVNTAAGRSLLPCFHPPSVALAFGFRRLRVDAVIALSTSPVKWALVPDQFFQQKEGSMHAGL